MKIYREYWNYLSFQNTMGIEKDGLLHFLIKTFKYRKWNITDEIMHIVLNIRHILMEIYDALYKIKEEQGDSLDIEEIAFTICNTIECLPSKMSKQDIQRRELIEIKPEKVKEEEKEQPEEKAALSLHEDDALKANASEREDASLSSHENQSKEGQKVCEENELRQDQMEIIQTYPEETNETQKQLNCEKVIECIKQYIVKEQITIREAFNLSKSNADKKIDRLELKKTIKEICKTKVTYQEIEDAVEFIEKKSKSDAESNALAFAEFSRYVKKALKRADYANCKPKPEESKYIIYIL